jgi:hypothetical protein
MRHRISLTSNRCITYALLIGLMVGAIHLVFHAVFHDSYPGDYVWALRTAYTLLNGIDPYGFTPDPQFIPYPLPVALFGFPLVWTVGFMSMVVAGSIFIGVSSGVMAWSLLRANQVWRLASILLSGTFWVAVITGQWSPLIVAAWFLPVLAPLLVLIKPQIALPVALARPLSRWGLLIASTVLLLSLAVDPTWPFRFLQKIGPYQGIIPALTLPFGPLLLLAVFRWSNERGRLLLMMALMPQRAVYDFLPLWLVPATRRSLLILSALSWLVVAPGIPTWPEMVSTPDIRWGSFVLYFAALVMIIWPWLVARRSSSSALLPAVEKDRLPTAEHL